MYIIRISYFFVAVAVIMLISGRDFLQSVLILLDVCVIWIILLLQLLPNFRLFIVQVPDNLLSILPLCVAAF
jgi:hypothetical protein